MVRGLESCSGLRQPCNFMRSLSNQYHIEFCEILPCHKTREGCLNLAIHSKLDSFEGLSVCSDSQIVNCPYLTRFRASHCHFPVPRDSAALIVNCTCSTWLGGSHCILSMFYQTCRILFENVGKGHDKCFTIHLRLSWKLLSKEQGSEIISSKKH